MVELTDKLCQEKVKIGVIVQKIEIGEDYMSYVRTILPKLNQIMTEIFRLMQRSELQIELNIDFVVQVLQDIVYGIEQEDKVFLLDVLKYGLEEIFDYLIEMLAGEKMNKEIYKQNITALRNKYPAWANIIKTDIKENIDVIVEKALPEILY